MRVRLAGMTSLCLLAGCSNQTPAANRPRIVLLSRPSTLASQPVPTTMDQALEALDGGLSGTEFQIMQLLGEDDAVWSLFAVGQRIQSHWDLSNDGPLRRDLSQSGFQNPSAMSEAILRSFWRRLHGRPLDLPSLARDVNAVREAARVAPHTVLFSEQSAERLTRQCSRRPMSGITQGTWMPDADMIAKLEDALLPALQQALDRKASPGWPLLARDYYRQYGGLIVDGKRIIYINGFHQSSLAPFEHDPERAERATHWRTTVFGVCDGWLRYFGAEYDPDTQQVYAIEFNGHS